MLSRTLTAVIIAAALVVASTLVIFYAEPTPKRGEGTISGTVSIGPTAPVCRTNATMTEVPSAWSSDQVVATPESGAAIHVPVAWSVSMGCELSGSFQAAVPAGTYKVDLSGCMSESSRAFGCASLPMTVAVLPNATASISIRVDTGIR